MQWNIYANISALLLSVRQNSMHTYLINSKILQHLVLSGFYIVILYFPFICTRPDVLCRPLWPITFIKQYIKAEAVSLLSSFSATFVSLAILNDTTLQPALKIGLIILEVWLQTVLASTVDGASFPSRFTPQEELPVPTEQTTVWASKTSRSRSLKDVHPAGSWTSFPRLHSP